MDFIIELRDSDGNDGSVSDILVSAPDADAAMDAALDWATETLGGEPDGDSGAYYDCDCEPEPDRWQVRFSAHSGCSPAPDRFDSEEDARAAYSAARERLIRIGQTVSDISDTSCEAEDPEDAAMASDDAGILSLVHVPGEEPACDGHGGWMLGTPEPMPPATPAYYHRKIDIR